jgi:hypothetical protein
MLGAQLVGEWLKARGLELRAKPQTNGNYEVKLGRVKGDDFKADTTVEDEDMEVALKVAMNLWDRDPEAGKG